MKSLIRVNDIKTLVNKYSGNNNPSIWILDINDYDSKNHAIPIKNVFIDDDGDVIIQVNKKSIW